MSDLIWLSEMQVRRIEPHFPLSDGVLRGDDRRVIRGIHSHSLDPPLYEIICQRLLMLLLGDSCHEKPIQKIKTLFSNPNLRVTTRQRLLFFWGRVSHAQHNFICNFHRFAPSARSRPHCRESRAADHEIRPCMRSQRRRETWG